MNATSLKAVRATAAALLSVPALAACALNEPQTDEVYTPADGENARDGQVDVLNALVVSDSPGSGRLIASLVNNVSEDDELTAVESEEVTVSLEDGETTVAGGGLLALGADESALLSVTGDDLEAGGFVRVTFVFQNAEEATLNVPVLAPGEDYADVELPSSEGSGSPSESPSASPSEEPSESPSEEPSEGVEE